jgi:hypothetical protein
MAFASEAELAISYPNNHSDCQQEGSIVKGKARMTILMQLKAKGMQHSG